MLQDWLKKLSHGLDDFIESLARMWDRLKLEKRGGTFTNLDPSFCLNERNYHEQNIMDINDTIQRLEEKRAQHEYYMNIADTMYSKLIQKVN